MADWMERNLGAFQTELETSALTQLNVFTSQSSFAANVPNLKVVGDDLTENCEGKKHFDILQYWRSLRSCGNQPIVEMGNRGMRCCACKWLRSRAQAYGPAFCRS